MSVVKEISRICDEKYYLVINYIQHNKRPMFVYYSFVGISTLWFFMQVKFCQKFVLPLCLHNRRYSIISYFGELLNAPSPLNSYFHLVVDITHNAILYSC